MRWPRTEGDGQRPAKNPSRLGRPSRGDEVMRRTTPDGIGRLLELAAADARFCRRLLRDREAVLRAPPLALSEAEASVLRSISTETLERMVDAVAPRMPSRRKMLVRVASALGFLGLLSTVVQTSSCFSTGVRPDGESEPVVTGVRPDAPPGGESQATRGTRPD
jgi:hypothetical protein